MSFTEENLLPLSALQHLLFCERQCALIHLERVWVENRWTAEGRQLHRKAHEAPAETRDGVRITRGLPLRSYQLGLTGQTDVVTWKPADDISASSTLARVLRDADSQELQQWEITPVEYKRGRPKKNDCDRVQLCAQAMCLEEMLGISIPAGQLFYGQKRRRFEVLLDESLRDKTRSAAARLHQLVADGRTPTARREKKCETCSLLELCLPDVASPARSAQRYLIRAVTNHLAASGPDSDDDGE